jgi:hypothetical protein
MIAYLSVEQEAYFPRLTRIAYRVTSPATPNYNCIAHAAGRSDSWWWPEDAPGVLWPEGVAKEATVTAFVEAYAQDGYEECSSPALEAGFEKIALYVDLDGVPTHAAHQLPDGSWSSKLGEWEDIEHATLEALEDYDHLGLGYGTVGRLLRRRSPHD